MIRIPLSVVGDAKQFKLAVEDFRQGLEDHLMGKPGRQAPVADSAIHAVVARVPQDGPVATRGPDQFIIREYEIVDDAPVSPEVQILRDSING